MTSAAANSTGTWGRASRSGSRSSLTGTNHTVTITLGFNGSGSGALGYRLLATRAVPHKMDQEIWHTNPQETIYHPWGPNVSVQRRGRWRGITTSTTG